MKWLRLYITVEGQTEREFASLVLAPYLAEFSMEVKPRVVLTNRKLGKRGGILDFAKIEGDLTRLMRQDQHPEAHFTTMIDLYALPDEFPGWSDAMSKPAAPERVKVLESALWNRFPDPRFHPYIQLHEFEALLYCDLTELQKLLPDAASGIAGLESEIRGLRPEEINQGAATAPSKRIIRHLPVYERSKVRVGAQAAAAIGLPALRAKCPHFDEWLTLLERLAP